MSNAQRSATDWAKLFDWGRTNDLNIEAAGIWINEQHIVMACPHCSRQLAFWQVLHLMTHHCTEEGV